MPKYLVVANKTLGGAQLLSEVRQRVSAGGATFHIVVPAAASDRDATYTEGAAIAAAEKRLADAIERLGALGAKITGEVGDGDPVDAINDALDGREFDEILLCTLPPGASRWLGLDVISRVEDAFDLPVVHIVVQD